MDKTVVVLLRYVDFYSSLKYPSLLGRENDRTSYTLDFTHWKLKFVKLKTLSVSLV